MALTGIHHVSLTVPDLEASVSWFADLLGMDKLMEETYDGGRAVVLARPEVGLFLSLHSHDHDSGDRFDELRTGMDHLAIGVSDRAELERWERTWRRRASRTPPSPTARGAPFWCSAIPTTCSSSSPARRRSEEKRERCTTW